MLANENNVTDGGMVGDSFSSIKRYKTTQGIIQFIYDCLIIYRQLHIHIGRIKETSQNQNLLDIMDEESRKSDFYYCRNEAIHDVEKGIEPKIDIGLREITKGIGDSVFMIECKRLRKPPSKSQQYVIDKNQGTGGIQRFKEESHAPTLSKSAIVGYMEDESFDFWFEKVNKWIDSEAKNDTTGLWNINDKITSTQIGVEICQYQSKHNRKTQPNITLYHFWVKMF